MSDANEFLMVAYESNQNWSVSTWNYNTGNIEHFYKNGGSVCAKTLCQLGNDYILTAEKEKPLLHIWPINSQEQIKNIRFVLPEPAKAVAVHPSYNYLTVAVNSKLYIWHLNSGVLLNIIQKHYLFITCVKFCNTGEYLVTAGEDGMLITYKFSDTINLLNNYVAQSQAGQCEPLYCKMDNSTPILNIYVGNFGSMSRVTTVSNDQTCRVYNLQSGEPLLVLVFDTGLSAVTFDSPCWSLFIGNNKGLINKVNLKNPSRTLEQHIDLNQSEMNFVGHQKKIICLCLNISNNILASSSEDGSFIIWEVKSRNILRRVEKGIITNMIFVQDHVNMSLHTLKPQVILKPLQGNLDSDSIKYSASLLQSTNITFNDEQDETNSNVNESVFNLENELVNAKILNKQLYNTIIKITKKYNCVK